MRRLLSDAVLLAIGSTLLGGCLSSEIEGLAPARSAATTVKLDLLHTPLPEIPLPNDLATRYDRTSATGRRINASMVASTRFESNLRKQIDQLDGWGVFQQIAIPFTGPLDVQSILRAHRDPHYGLADDVLYLIDVDPRSPEFGRVHHLDVGNGNYPVVLEKMDYWKNDPRGWVSPPSTLPSSVMATISLLFEEANEDLNHNGVLDPGEDTDSDGHLDTPNYLPGKTPARTDLAGRADAMMSFYEKETHTLLARPMQPLRERTTYAVVVTRRLRDAAGRPVGSPYPTVNHPSQTAALGHLRHALPEGLTLDDVAFAFSFTTQSVQSHWRAVREGLYGVGVQAHLGRDFPAEVAGLERLRDVGFWKDLKNPHVVYSEQLTDLLKPLAVQLGGIKEGSESMRIFLDAYRYVDYAVVGSFKSPQLFPRTATALSDPPTAAPGDEGGLCFTNATCNRGVTCLNGRCIKMLPWNEQAWPPDLDRVPARAREETVYFWMTVPRKEVSLRGQGKPAPVVIMSHGYTSSKTEALLFGSLLARQGLATISIDCPSHGLPIGPKEEALAKALIGGKGFDSFLAAILKDRSFDQNNDGVRDPGADFWSAYVFHTRDMVRQAGLDYTQLVRILRTFDGQRRWKIDVNGDGQPELAGDFDGDGQVDVGGDAPIGMAGGSLGGIMSLFTGAVEPQLSMIAPISGGAGLADIGIRSRQGGVPEAFYLRVMSPLYVATFDGKSGETLLETIVPDLNRAPSLPFASVNGVKPGDTMVVENLANLKRGCSAVTAEGTARATVESDLDDRTRVLFYSGNVLEGPECRVRAGAQATITVSTFEKAIAFQDRYYAVGDPLTALAEGLGLRRATPELRRFISFGQLVIDPGDPAPYLRQALQERFSYRVLKDGREAIEQTGAHVLAITTVGDMNVPANTGINAARFAGLIDHLRDDPRFGKPPCQVLIDTFTTEAVNTYKRYTDTAGNGVHLDIDNLSRGTDMWSDTIPRQDPPLRFGWDRKDALGGVSAAIFPYSDPGGTHGFDLPGQMTDRARQACLTACKESGADPCGCKTKLVYDIGLFMFNMMGEWFESRGTVLRDDLCHAHDNCSTRKPAPPLRDPTTLR